MIDDASLVASRPHAEALWETCFREPAAAREAVAAWAPASRAAQQQKDCLLAMLNPLQYVHVDDGALFGGATLRGLDREDVGPVWTARLTAIVARVGLARVPFWEPPEAACVALLEAVSPLLSASALDRALAHHILALVRFRRKENTQALDRAVRAEQALSQAGFVRMRYQVTVLQGMIASRMARFSDAASAYVAALQISAQHNALFSREEMLGTFGNMVITLWKMGHVADVVGYADWLSAYCFGALPHLSMRLSLVSIAAFHKAATGELTAALSLVQTRLSAEPIPARLALLRSLLLAAAGETALATQALSEVPENALFQRGILYNRALILATGADFQRLPAFEALAVQGTLLPVSPVEQHILIAYVRAVRRLGESAPLLEALLQRQHERVQKQTDTLAKRAVLLDLKLRLSRGEAVLLREALEKTSRALHAVRGRQRLELELTASVHDINNHLQIVLAELALANTPATMQVAVEAIESASRLNHSILRSIRADRVQPAARGLLSVDAVVAATEPHLRRLIGDASVLSLSLGSGAWVRGNPEQLKDVLINLVKNAVEAMPSGGTVRVETVSRGEWARVVVSDTGPGVSPAVRAVLFEPFATSKVPGAGIGIGLWHAREVLRAHGGNLTLEPSPTGARFMLSLPQVTR